jgi:hypothetical protein
MLALALALLAGAACIRAPALGAQRAPLLAAGCAGLVATVALCLPGGDRDPARSAAATATLLVALCSCIVLILVCAIASVPSGE